MLCRVAVVLVSCVVAEVVWAAPPLIISSEPARSRSCSQKVSEAALSVHFQQHDIEGGTARVGDYRDLSALIGEMGTDAESAESIVRFVSDTVKFVGGPSTVATPRFTGLLSDLSELFDRKVEAGEVTVVLFSERVRIGKPFSNEFLNNRVFGKNRWVLFLSSEVWKSPRELSRHVVMGLAPAAAIEMLLNWKDAARELIARETRPRASYYALLVNHESNRPRPGVGSLIIELYQHLALRQWYQRVSPEKLKTYRKEAAKSVSSYLVSEIAPSCPADVQTWLRASVNETTYWNFTEDVLGAMNDLTVGVASSFN